MTDDLRSEAAPPGAPINPAARRLLTRALGHLAATLGAGLELREDETILLSIPRPADAATAATPSGDGPGGTGDDIELLFSGYLLRILGRDELTPNEYREVRIYRRLADVLLRGVRESGGSGGMSAGYLIEALTEILRITEQRGRLVDSYRRIIELNQKILAAENLQMVLRLILELIEDIVHAEGSSLLLVDQRTGEMHFTIATGEKDEALKRILIPEGQGIAGDVVRTARAELIRDVPNDPRMFQKVDRLLKQTTRDMIIAPIIAREQVIGVVEAINSKSPFGFLSEDLEILVHIASHASLFVEDMRTKEMLALSRRQADRRNTQIQALFELEKISGDGEDPATMRKAIERILSRALRLRSAQFHPLSADGRRLENLAAVEITNILLWLRQNREPFYFHDLPRTPGDTGPAPHTGLAVRFREANPELFAGDSAPDLWLPLPGSSIGVAPGSSNATAPGSSDSGSPGPAMVLLSLAGDLFAEPDPVGDRPFFLALMRIASRLGAGG